MIELHHDWKWLETKLKALTGGMMAEAMSGAMTRTAATARRDVMAELPKVFHEPTRFTVNSIRYKPSMREQHEARVLVSDDAAKGMSPRKYLGPEIAGGPRSRKRSERALTSRGLIDAGQFIVPGKAAPLDRHGNIPAGVMTQVLSKLKAFGEQGYRANISDARQRRLEKAKRAVRSTRTDIFVGHAKRGGEPIAVYQLAGRGHVRPLLGLVGKAPNYKVRFDFFGMVEKSAALNWTKEVGKAVEAAFKKAAAGR